jgi:hypothetical protein
MPGQAGVAIRQLFEQRQWQHQRDQAEEPPPDPEPFIPTGVVSATTGAKLNWVHPEPGEERQ